MRIRNLATGLIFLSMATPASAWDDQGHMMIAAAAYDQLSPKTKARVAELLALSAYPTDGVNNAKRGDAAKAAFMMAATGPDAIKKDTQHFTNDGEDPSKAPHAGDNVGFSDRNMHKYWHYTDEPFSPDGTALVQPPSINVQERIALFRKTLASNAPDTLKTYDLVWLLHLVGDVHQPLHATSRFTHAAPKGDNGGNRVKLCTTPCRDELHAFWDDVAGKSENVSTAINAARALAAADPAQAAKTDAAVWVEESFEVAKTVVYSPPIGPGLGPFTLDNAYKSKAKQVAKERIALAGARLANLLNDELK